jgi:Chalcone isomerase-like
MAKGHNVWSSAVNVMTRNESTASSKKRRIWPSAALALVLACASPAISGAVTIDGVTVAPTVPVSGRVLRLNGAGLRTLTAVSIHAYVASLYLEDPSSDSDAILASPGIKMLTLQYLRAASKEQVQEVFQRAENRYCGAGGCPASEAPDFARLVASFPAVKRGDYTTYLFSPRGVQVFINNVTIATVNNPDVARGLLDAFIGPRAASQQLRNALLGRQ